MAAPFSLAATVISAGKMARKREFPLVYSNDSEIGETNHFTAQHINRVLLR